MRFTNGTKVGIAAMAHAATKAAGMENIHFVQSTKLPEPKLTTVLGDVIQRPIPTGGGDGTIVFNTEICRPVTTSTCDIVQVTSTMTPTEVVVDTHTSSVVVTTSQGTSSTVSQAETTTTAGSITGSTGTPMTTVVSQTPSETSVPISGGDKDADGAGILAGLALLLLI